MGAWGECMGSPKEYMGSPDGEIVYLGGCKGAPA